MSKPTLLTVTIAVPDDVLDALDAVTGDLGQPDVADVIVAALRAHLDLTPEPAPEPAPVAEPEPEDVAEIRQLVRDIAVRVGGAAKLTAAAQVRLAYARLRPQLADAPPASQVRSVRALVEACRELGTDAIRQALLASVRDIGAAH